MSQSEKKEETGALVKIDFDAFIEARNAKYPELRQITRNDLADKYGITYVTISKYSTGKTPPIVAILRDMMQEKVLPFKDLVTEFKPKK